MTFSSTFPPSGQGNYERYMSPALAGMMSGMGSKIVVPALNNVATVDTVTITPPATVDNSTAYSITLVAAAASGSKNLTVSFTTDGSATTAELGAGLYAAIIADPEFYSIVDAALNTGTSVITLSARAVGTLLTVTSNSAATTNDLTIARTAGSANAIIPFGRFVGRQSSYYRDPVTGFSAMNLVSHASNFSDYGITLLSQATEQVGLYNQTQDGYAFGRTMEVLKKTGTYRGVWIETVESNLAIGASARIEVTAGNEGKLTANTSGTVNISSLVTVISATQQAFGKNITLCQVNF